MLSFPFLSFLVRIKEAIGEVGAAMRAEKEMEQEEEQKKLKLEVEKKENTEDKKNEWSCLF